MTLWSHLRAHWRDPVHGLREWWTLGRHANWDDQPTGVVVAKFGGNPVVTWNPCMDPDPTPRWRCDHMTLSGQAVRDPSCGACGPMRAVA